MLSGRDAGMHAGARAALTMIVIAEALLAGCQSAAPRAAASDPTAAPAAAASRMSKEDASRRALDLLLRAADGDVDVLRCNAIEALVKVAPDRAVPAIRTALKSDVAMVRFAGCAAAGEIRDRESLDLVLRALRDSDERVRLAAAYAAYRLGEASAAQTLIDALSGSADENLRSDAAYFIGKLGEPRAIKRLKSFAGDKSKKVVIHVYMAMAMLGDEDAVARLVEYAQGDLVARMLALQGLVETTSERAREALLYRVSPVEEYIQARLLAARGLGKLRSGVGYQLATQQLSYNGKDETETYGVRSLAALALGAIGDARAIPLLVRAAETEDDARTQIAICYAICQVVPPPK
ncbi:MAG: HEAT repeat domain-containing protein [Phycisphaerae bacterium]